MFGSRLGVKPQPFGECGRFVNIALTLVIARGTRGSNRNRLDKQVNHVLPFYILDYYFSCV